MINLSRLTAQMANKAKTLLPKQSRGAGSFSFGPYQIPLGSVAVSVRCERDNWTDTGDVVAEIQLEGSFDGGSSWRPLCGWKDKGGGSNPESWAMTSVPNPENANRLVRGQLIQSAAVATSVVVGIR